MHGWYENYTPLNTSRENIYQECANTEFQKAKMQPHFPTCRSPWTDKSKYYLFHKGHNHNTNDYIQLKDVIEALINKRRQSDYVKGDKRD